MEIITKKRRVMNMYQCLRQLDELGLLRPLMCKGAISAHLLQWMEIYEYHLEHSSQSQFQVALKFHTNKSTVWEAYHFMNQEVMS